MRADARAAGWRKEFGGLGMRKAVLKWAARRSLGGWFRGVCGKREDEGRGEWLWVRRRELSQMGNRNRLCT